VIRTVLPNEAIRFPGTESLAGPGRALAIRRTCDAPCRFGLQPGALAHIADKAVATQVLDAHLRSLQLNHLTDVASTDQNTVKPWFVGKLDFAPPVAAFAAEGFPLVGGRLDVVGGRAVAALVYNRRKHVVNLFVWPSEEADAAPRSGMQRGYSWIRWTRDGMSFWAASDAAASDLGELFRLVSRS
jgi:anti-sigma factor RsiW